MQLVEYIPDYVVFDLETTGTSCNYGLAVALSILYSNIKKRNVK